MRSPIAAAIAIALGLIVLVGYFIDAATDNAALSNLLLVRTFIIDWAVILAAFATLVGILGLVIAHWNKLRAKRNPDRYSIFTVLGFLIAFGFGVFAYAISGDVNGFQVIVNSIQMPVEASLMAVVAVTLTLASFRLFQRRKGLLPVIFILSALLFLLFNSGLLASLDNINFMGGVLLVIQTLPIAGGRGILLGIALGSILAGLRILFGAERPYSG